MFAFHRQPVPAGAKSLSNGQVGYEAGPRFHTLNEPLAPQVGVLASTHIFAILPGRICNVQGLSIQIHSRLYCRFTSDPFYWTFSQVYESHCLSTLSARIGTKPS